MTSNQLPPSKYSGRVLRGNNVRLRPTNRESPIVTRPESTYASDFEDELEIDLFHEKLSALKAKSKRENHGSADTDAAIAKLEQEIDDKIAHKAETSYSRYFEMLTLERTRSSQEQREEALAGIVQRLTAKYAPDLYKLHDLETLNKAMLSGHSEEETTLGVRAYLLEALLNIDESFDYITSTSLPSLNKLSIDEDIPTQSRAAFITGYSVLQYFIHVGNGGFGLDEKIEELKNLCTENATAENPIVCCASLLGVGLLIAAVESRNFAIKETLPDIVELLKDGNIEVRKLAGKVVALMYELYDFTEQGAGTTNEQEYDGFAYVIPTVENDYIISLLETLVNDQGKPVAKKERAEHRTIFRKVLATVGVRLVPLGPRQAEHADISPEDNASHVISHLHFNASKALPIKSWHQLLLTSALKWVYGSGLLAQVANNDLIADAVIDASTEAIKITDNAFAVSGASTPKGFTDTLDVSQTAKAMDKNITRNRDLKNQAFMGSEYPVKG